MEQMLWDAACSIRGEKDAAKFKTAADTMVTEIGKLDAAAKSGNLDAIKAAMGATGKSCKACHDDFRAEKYSAN